MTEIDRSDDIQEVGSPLDLPAGPLGAILLSDQPEPRDEQTRFIQYPIDEHSLSLALDRSPRFADGTALVPVVAGTPWYENFDHPVKVVSKTHGNIYVIGLDEDLGQIRGGHCFDMKPPRLHDKNEFWPFYNQGDTPYCTGYGPSRALSQVHGEEFDAVWLYEENKKVDGTPSQEGSTVDAAMRVLKAQGPKKTGDKGPTESLGIDSYHWATSWEQIRTILGVPNTTPFVPFCNSWGEDYPHVVFIHDSAGETIFSESEFGIMVPR